MMHRRTRFVLRISLAAAAAIALAGNGTAVAQTDIVTFSAGSLIIPMQANFQTSCGTLSAYGLVWRLLQSNQPGRYNSSHPVTVYWTINGSKSTPNLCVPSNLNTPPSPNTFGPSGDSTHWDDLNWNTGCDFGIANRDEQPVAPVDYSVPYPLTGFYAKAAVPMISTVGSTFVHRDARGSDTVAYALPAYTGVVLDDNGINPNRFNRIQYMGGPFVIEASDAKNVIDFLRTGDAYVSPSDLAPFVTPGTCGTIPDASTHYVQMHQARIQFTAVVAKRMNRDPPKIALVDSGTSVKFGSLYLPNIRVLDTYLKLAGLYTSGTANHTDSGGCPNGTFSGCNINGSDATTQYPGYIYDRIDLYSDTISTSANPNGLINSVDPVTGKRNYSVLWTPHVDTTNLHDYQTNQNVPPPNYSQYAANGDGAGTDQIRNSLNNISWFLNTRGSALMAQCSSIGSLEGARDSGGTNIPSRSALTNFMFSNTINPTYSIKANAATGIGSVPPTFDGRSCLDPDYSGTGNCIVFGFSGMPIAQTADFHFIPQEGSVKSFAAYDGNTIRKPGVVAIATNWQDYNSTNYPNSPPPTAGNDLVSFSYKDNDTNKGAILYLAGHEYEENTAGARIVLNTFFNLGADPLGPERAIAAPIAFNDSNGNDIDGTAKTVFTPTYDAITGYGYSTEVFQCVQGSNFKFPLNTGHLRQHSLVGRNVVLPGESDFNTSFLWDADQKMPLPQDRNVFTYLGATFATNASAPNGVLQQGWFPVPVTYGQIADPTVGPNPNCIDRLQWTALDARFGGLGPGPDGICDLQQALQMPEPAGVTTANQPANRSAALAAAKCTAQLVQRVRGHCFATSTRNDASGSPIFVPADNQCNDIGRVSNNRARLGALVHSSPAIVPPSSHIPDSGAPRPTVAYVGGLDGQLHAFYVSGGGGYLGPARGIPTGSAAAVFTTDWAARLSAGNMPAPGTELWSFIPASQLPLLASNQGRIDGSPVVQDVLTDWGTQTGVRSYYTLLFVPFGLNGREYAILDVTDPLLPVLKFDIQGTLFQIGGFPQYLAGPLATTDTGGLVSVAWDNPRTKFFDPPVADSGRSFTGPYNLGNLGASSGFAITQDRGGGLAPKYLLLATSNMSEWSRYAAKGVALFTVDIASGQKNCEWDHPYSGTDNSMPSPATVRQTANGPLIYVGDMQGVVWELTSNCKNANRDPTCTSPPCFYPAFNGNSTVADPQPISTNLALAKVPANATGVFAAYPGATLLLWGTTGADWVPATVTGKLHAVILDARYRVPFLTGGTDINGGLLTLPMAKTLAASKGVLQEVPGYPLQFPGQHLYGSIVVTGQTLYFSTAAGAIGNPMQTSGTTSGNTYQINLGNQALPTATALPISLANFGGVAVLEEVNGTNSITHVYGTEVSKQFHYATNNGAPTGPASPTATLSTTNNGVFYRFLNMLMSFVK